MCVSLCLPLYLSLFLPLLLFSSSPLSLLLSTFFFLFFLLSCLLHSVLFFLPFPPSPFYHVLSPSLPLPFFSLPIYFRSFFSSLSLCCLSLSSPLSRLSPLILSCLSSSLHCLPCCVFLSLLHLPFSSLLPHMQLLTSAPHEIFHLSLPFNSLHKAGPVDCNNTLT